MDAPPQQPVKIPTTSISDALDELGINGVLGGVRGLPGSALTVGIARTALVVECREGRLPGLSDLFDTARPGEFLTFGWAADIAASVFGGLAAKRAMLKGYVGLVVDGWVRDADELAGTFPVWCRGTTPRTGRGRLAVREVTHPVVVGGAVITAGDTIVADETGVCVIPQARLDEVWAAARAIVDRDAEVERSLDAGASFDAAHDGAGSR
jgi:regulator of RNase E activity RraA